LPAAAASEAIRSSGIPSGVERRRFEARVRAEAVHAALGGDRQGRRAHDGAVDDERLLRQVERHGVLALDRRQP
jgi:hypothetical protein